MLRDKMDATILVQCLDYTNPSYSQQEVSRKRSSWQKFMKSLSWEQSVEKKAKSNPMDMFKNAGLPIMDITQIQKGGKK